MGFEPAYLVMDAAQHDELLEEAPRPALTARLGDSPLARVPLLRRLWYRVRHR